MSEKVNTSKQVSIFLQAKGGVGKSFIGYFKVLGSEAGKTAVFLLDSSQKANQNADRHAKLLGSENVHVVNIYNAASEYKRSHFFDIFEAVSKIDRPLVILDIGAPESNVLREALETDEELTGENLKFIAGDLGLDMTFNVIVSGADDNVNENLNYYVALSNTLAAHFKVNMLINDVTFKADRESEALRTRLIEKGLGNESNIMIVGKSGHRNNDNPFLTIMSVANGETSLEDAQKSMSARIRLRKMLEPLAAV